VILEELIDDEGEVMEMHSVKLEPREQETRLDAREEALIEKRVHPAGEERARRQTERDARDEHHDPTTGLWTTTTAAAQAGASNRRHRPASPSNDSEEGPPPKRRKN
jgi:hypothetical protein